MDFQELLGRDLLVVGTVRLTLAVLLTLLVIAAATLLVSRLVQAGLRRAFAKRGVPPERGAGIAGRVAHYAILLVGFGVALQTIGISIGSLFTAGAIFAVGIGFAMQNISQNFVSGVILLAERSIRQGDILEIDGLMVRVREMGIRATMVRTREEEDLIVPNSSLVQSTVKNLTLTDNLYRLRTKVGVTYSSDLEQVSKTLRAVAGDLAVRHQGQDPRVMLRDFGSSSVDFEVSIWIEDPWDALPFQSELRYAIWRAFKKEGIVIAFPQLDVHLDAPVTQAIVSHQKKAA